MPDMWFVVGIALGTIVTGFCAIGSFERGSESVLRRSWSVEHAARSRAVLAADKVRPTVAATGKFSKAS